MKRNVCLLIGCLLAGCALQTKKDSMNPNENPATGAAVLAPLPVEPGSEAEILLATHLFTVEWTEARAGTWAAESDGLEHRRLHLKARLLEQLKGELSVELGSTFELDLRQHREDELTISDYHGFWSHHDPLPGAKNVVLASGTGTDPVALMQEPAIRALLDPRAEVDIRTSGEAEQKFGADLRHATTPILRERIAAGLLTFTQERRGACHGLFGRYIWARIGPVFPGTQDELLAPALDLVQAEDTTIELREVFVYGLYAAVSALPPDRERSTKLIHAFLNLLLRPEAASLHDRLLQVPLFNLLFRTPSLTPSATVIIPDPAERARLIAVAIQFKSERASKVGAWLDGR